MHAEGIIVFRSAASLGAGQQWFAVFHDGSFVAATGDGRHIVRFSDGSTCENADKGKAEEAVAGDAHVDWVSTAHDGKRCGITLPCAAESQLEAADNISAEVCSPLPLTFYHEIALGDSPISVAKISRQQRF